MKVFNELDRDQQVKAITWAAHELKTCIKMGFIVFSKGCSDKNIADHSIYFAQVTKYEDNGIPILVKPIENDQKIDFNKGMI